SPPTRRSARGSRPPWPCRRRPAGEPRSAGRPRTRRARRPAVCRPSQRARVLRLSGTPGCRMVGGTVKTPAAAVGVLLLVVIAAGAAEGQLRSRPFVSGLSIPVAIVQDPTDPTVQFVVEQRGLIRVVKTGALLDTDFLDLRNAVAPDGGERGLFSIAFPPDAL